MYLWNYKWCCNVQIVNHDWHVQCYLCDKNGWINNNNNNNNNNGTPRINMGFKQNSITYSERSCIHQVETKLHQKQNKCGVNFICIHLPKITKLHFVSQSLTQSLINSYLVCLQMQQICLTVCWWCKHNCLMCKSC
jgi:hypothetical protein